MDALSKAVWSLGPAVLGAKASTQNRKLAACEEAKPQSQEA